MHSDSVRHVRCWRFLSAAALLVWASFGWASPSAPGAVPAIRADLLRQLGRDDEALTESKRAIELTRNESERQFLDAQIRDRSIG